MPTHRVGASLYAVRYYGRNATVHTGGAANSAGTSYGIQYSYKNASPIFKDLRKRTKFYGELTIVPPVASRGLISWIELETPIIETRARVSWAEFQVPNIITRARNSWIEFQAPNRATRGRVSWLELETPLAPTRGRISYTELQIPNRLTRGRVSWNELQAPNSPTRGIIVWAELQVPDGFIPIDFWCANTGNSAITGGGDIEELER